MGRPGVTYEQTAAVCDDLLKNGQKITLRDIMARTGGSPNHISKHWHTWQTAQESIALKHLEEDFSPEIKHAIRAEFARKMQALRAEYDNLKQITEQQLADLRRVLEDALAKKEALKLDIGVVSSELRDEERKTAIAEQRFADCSERLNDREERLAQAEKAKERAIAEKDMLANQLTELQGRFSRLEQHHQALQSQKHQLDIELATLKVSST